MLHPIKEFFNKVSISSLVEVCLARDLLQSYSSNSNSKPSSRREGRKWERGSGGENGRGWTVTSRFISDFISIFRFFAFLCLNQLKEKLSFALRNFESFPTELVAIKLAMALIGTGMKISKKEFDQLIAVIEKRDHFSRVTLPDYRPVNLDLGSAVLHTDPKKLFWCKYIPCIL